jgi:hypothetical protein
MAATAVSAASAVSALHQQGHALREAMVGFLTGQTGLDEPRARAAEVGAFNWALARAKERRVACNWRNPAFQLMYESKARSVACNLEPGGYVGNGRLRQRLDEREFAPGDIATMQPDHVFPERWRDVVEDKVRRDEYITNAKTTAMTDRFKCGRCKRRECTYMELQTRSCDEPASLFIQCLACGHHWRLG